MVSCLLTVKFILFNIFLSPVYPKETSLNSITPSIVFVVSPVFTSSSKSNWSNISFAAANPFCITPLILDNCLIGYAIKPAAVKNAT